MKTIKNSLSALLVLFLVIGQIGCSITSKNGSPGAPGASSSEMALRRNIVEYGLQFEGAPYEYAGKDPKGFDCSGYTSYVMRPFNINLSPSSRLQEEQGKKISVEKVKPGDLIFYRRTAQGDVFHVSLVISNNPDGIKVIHAVSRGVAIDNISTSTYWAPMIKTAREVINQ